MKRIFNQVVLTACAAALAAVSCSKEPEEGRQPDRGEGISILTTLGNSTPDAVNGSGAETKAPVADGGTNAKIALGNMHFLRKDGATMQTGFAGVTALVASREATGQITFTAGSVPSYDKSNLNAWFTAYWPATSAEGATVTAGSQVVWTVDGSRDILLSTLDASGSFDAGRYSAPGTGVMVLEHAMAQLQVVCTADAGVADAILEQAWGRITKIEILSSATTATYTYSNNTLSYGTAGALSLWKADYSARFEGQTYELTKNSTTVMAAGMYPPSRGAIRLKIYCEKVPGGKEVSVQLAGPGANKNFERGLTHKVTLTFGALPIDITVSASIIPWDVPLEQDVEIVSFFVPLFYGDAANNGGVTTGLTGFTETSYNACVAGANGSAYGSETEACAGELPYGRLQIARADEPTAASWPDAMTACRNKTADGGGWRLPRLSELKLISNNKSSLEAEPGFKALPPGGTLLWAGTEGTGAGEAFAFDFAAMRASIPQKTVLHKVRCVRELSPWIVTNQDAGGDSGITIHPPYTGTGGYYEEIFTGSDVSYPGSKEGSSVGAKYQIGSVDITPGTYMNRANAVSQCKAYREGGFTNWRLPTRRELVQIYELKRDGKIPNNFVENSTGRARSTMCRTHGTCTCLMVARSTPIRPPAATCVVSGIYNAAVKQEKIR